MAPSGPVVNTVGSALKGMEYVVTAPLGVMVPMYVNFVSLEAYSMENHRFPLGPSVIPHRNRCVLEAQLALPSLGSVNIVMAPVVVIRPMALSPLSVGAPTSVNQS